MSRRPKHPEPFFMLFPWLRAAGLLFLLAFLLIFILRLSETAGPESGRACLAAAITAGIAGLCSAYPIGKVWRRDIMVALIAVMAGSSIRLLIGGAGIAIITFFTQLNKSWYIFYVVLYYGLFLVVDTAFALWMLRHCRKSDDREQLVHGNLWDIVS